MAALTPMHFAVRAALALGTFLLAAGCASSHRRTERDAGTRVDTPPPIADAGSDAGADAGRGPERDAGADGGRDDDRCWDDVELVTLTGGRENVTPLGVYPYEDGWLVLYDAFEHYGTFGRFAAFLDHEGRLTARQALGIDDVSGARAVLGRYLFTARYDRRVLYEIGDGVLVDRSELLDPALPGRVELVGVDATRLRILSSVHVDPAAGSFRFVYSEIELQPDGSLTTRSAELPAVETLGSPGLLSGLSRYHQLHSFGLDGDTFVFAYPTGEGGGDLGPQPWHVVRVALDRSTLASGTASWSLLEETRWEEGPTSIFGLLPDLDLAIAGRFQPTGSDWAGEATMEAFVGAGAAPLVVVPRGGFPRSQLGPATMFRRGDQLGIATDTLFGVLALPTFDEEASAPIELAGAMAAWGDGVVLEVGSERTEDGIRGLVRCHELHAR